MKEQIAVVVEVGPKAMEALARRINAQYDNLQTLVKGVREDQQYALEAWVKLTDTLLEAKQSKGIPHGHWESWLEKNTKVSARTAQRWMQVRKASGTTLLKSAKSYTQVCQLCGILTQDKTKGTKQSKQQPKNRQDFYQSVDRYAERCCTTRVAKITFWSEILERATARLKELAQPAGHVIQGGKLPSREANQPAKLGSRMGERLQHAA